METSNIPLWLTHNYQLQEKFILQASKESLIFHNISLFCICYYAGRKCSSCRSTPLCFSPTVCPGSARFRLPGRLCEHTEVNP